MLPVHLYRVSGPRRVWRGVQNEETDPKCKRPTCPGTVPSARAKKRSRVEHHCRIPESIVRQVKKALQIPLNLLFYKREESRQRQRKRCNYPGICSCSVVNSEHFRFCRSYVVETAKPEREEDCRDKGRKCCKSRRICMFRSKRMFLTPPPQPDPPPPPPSTLQ